MERQRITYLTCCAASLLLLVAAAATPRRAGPQTAPAAPARDERPRLALLIGINSYKNPRIRALTSCENDVRLMKRTLLGDFRFEDANVKTLTGPQATRAEIISVFRAHLIEGARRAKAQNQEAVVVFHFSGHGSRTPDAESDDERDSWDETLVAFDSRTEGVYDILDDELQDLLVELSQHTTNVTFILDSCHSGTGTRGDLEVREAPVDGRPRPPYQRKYRLTDEELAARYVTISAALAHQRAYGRPSAVAEVPNGALTFHLAAALKRATRRTSYRSLLNEVAAAVRNEVDFQDPHVEGDVQRLVFGGAAERAEPYIEISEVKDGEVTFKAGKAHGIREGALVSIYAAGTAEHSGAQGWLTYATVGREVSDFVARARLPTAAENPRVAQVTTSSHLVLPAPNFGGGPLPVSLNHRSVAARGAAAATLRAAVRKHVEEMLLIDNRLLEFVEDAPDADSAGVLRLKYGRLADATDLPPAAALQRTCVGVAVVRPEATAEGYYLDAGGGLPLFGLFIGADDPRAAARVADAMSLYVKQHSLRSLENNASPLSQAVRVTLQRFPGKLTYACVNGSPKPSFAAAGPPVESAKWQLPLGEVFNLKLQNVSGRPLHVTAVLLSSDGSIRIIYPIFGDAEPLAGRQAAMPRAQVGETGRQATAAPAGRETVKLIVTKEWREFGFLEAKPVVRGPSTLLDRLLNQSGVKFRGEPLPAEDPGSWGVVTAHLDVEN